MISQRSSRAQQNYRRTDVSIKNEVDENLWTYLATSNASAEGILANTDLLVDVCVGEVVLAPGHRTHEDGDVVSVGQGGQELGELLHGGVTRERELDGVRGKVVDDGVLGRGERLAPTYGKSDSNEP